MSIQDEHQLDQLLTQANDNADEQLYPGEGFWRDQYLWLKERGYALRPRYNPEWKPSWKDTQKVKYACEDHLTPNRIRLMDATRIVDNTFVTLKRITLPAYVHEIKIGEYFSSPELRSEPRNFCVPILDVFEIPSVVDEAIIVMPMLRRFDDPPFESVGEVMDFFEQIFYGLQFMHTQRVAHLDCTENNIMMDPTNLYPDSYHPIATSKNRNYNGDAKHFARTQKPPKYYFIDFGLSRQYDPGTDLKAIKEQTVVRSGDKSPPEYYSREPFSPFATDVYLVGNLIRTQFLQKKRGFDFMSSLIERMTLEDPERRPQMDQVVADFEKIMKSLSTFRMRSRIADKNEFFPARIIRDFIHFGKRVVYWGSSFGEMAQGNAD